MLRPGRSILILLALVALGMLNVGCETPTTLFPTATLTHTALRIIPRPATVTNTTAPTRTAVEPVSSRGTSTTTPSRTPTPSPLPSTSTPTRTATSSPLPPTLTNTPTSTTTPVPATPTPVPTATRTQPPPTATPSPYRFLPTGSARPDPSNPCPGCPKAPAYIVGHVVDAAGNPLAGVRLVCYNEWHRYPIVLSKVSGEYDFAIIQAQTTWYVFVLDGADQPISPEVAVPFDPHETCRYILDWQRVN